MSEALRILATTKFYETLQSNALRKITKEHNPSINTAFDHNLPRKKEK